MKRTLYVPIVTLLALRATDGTIYFSETFDDNQLETRWVQSQWKPESELGTFTSVAIHDTDKAIQTSENTRFYALSAKLDHVLDNKDKDLFITYLVQHTQSLDCGGAYIKLFSGETDLTKFGGETPYSIMFGPDVCGSNKVTHAILTYARPNEEPINMNHQTNIRCDADQTPHLYALTIHPDNTYTIRKDAVEIQSGLISDNWPFLLPKEIPDPNQSKPDDWVDDEKIPDPTDIKPDNWDDIPKTIPDPQATEPEDWDEEDDGVWVPPQIDNPEYKGEWKPRMIVNPAYKGPWEHPKIPNPAYFEDDKLYNVAKNVGAIGLELWQVTSGTIFDDFLVTDEREAFEEWEKRVMEKRERMMVKKEEVKAEAKEEVTEEEKEDLDEKDEL